MVGWLVGLFFSEVAEAFQIARSYTAVQNHNSMPVLSTRRLPSRILSVNLLRAGISKYDLRGSYFFDRESFVEYFRGFSFMWVFGFTQPLCIFTFT